MKNFLKIVLIVVSSSFFTTCNTPQDTAGNFLLFPSPQKFDLGVSSGLNYSDIKYYYSLKDVTLPVCREMLKDLQITQTKSDAQVVFGLDPSMDLKPEGYTLDISDNQILIKGKDEAGLLYGFMTLEQLMEDSKDQDVKLPTCSITDYPLLAYRSIHLDIKHHRETTNYYYKLMDKLAKIKVNAIIVEVEDKIKYQSQPLVASSDAFSIDEWKKICNYAKDRNIEISPLVQGLGHASFILKHEEYLDLRDDLESDWAFNPLNPKTYDVQFDLYKDAIAATPHGKYLHIGGDEVHTTGRGSGQSPLELQLIWLEKVCKFAEDQGRIPIFWDDMPLKHAGVYRPMFNPDLKKEEVDLIWKENEHKLLEFIDRFPKNCIYMRWNYRTPGTYGNLKAMDWFKSNGFKVMGATAGQTRWVLMPQNSSNIENIKSFALSSIDKGLNGLLLTLWDDDSPHFELYIRGIMAFAEYTWAGEKRTVPNMKMAYRHRAFGPEFSNNDFAFIDKLEIPVGKWKNILTENGVDRNKLKKMDVEKIISVPDPNNKGEWSRKYANRLSEAKELLILCDSISNQLNEMKQMATKNQYNLEIYEQVNNLLKFTFESMIILEKFDLSTPELNEKETFENMSLIPEKFTAMRSKFENVYSKTRIIEKPDDYILDQDHHSHLANQSTSFDWQFYPELLLLEKISTAGKIIE